MAGIGKQKNNPALGVGLGVPGGNSGPGGGLNGVVGNYGSTGGVPPPQTIQFGGQSAADAASSIFDDPAFMALRNQLSAQGIGDAAHLRGAIQQALIGFGGVPQLSSDILNSTGIDTAGTQQLADNNPFSVLKRMAQNYQDQQDATKNQLAARGILSSGESGFQLGKLGQANAQNQYDATNSLLGNINGLYDTYAQGQQSAANQLAQGALTAEGNAAANSSSASSSSGGTATYDPATGLYKDANGNFYDPSGNPVALPGGGAQAPAPSGGGVAPGTAPVTPYDPTKLLTPGQTNAAI